LPNTEGGLGGRVRESLAEDRDAGYGGD